MIGMLIDVTKCVGCEKCVAACVKANGCDPAAADRDRATSPDGLSADRLTTVQPIGWDHFAKKACMHCLEPSCVSACLVGGITRSENGAVVYDPDKCIGCRYCMLACPFHVPRYEWSAKVPFMKKCELCEERLADGEIPACADACPQNAIEFGERDELLRLAHQRIGENPDGYIDHVWGEHEFGGTSVLYISDADLAELGWPSPDTESIPHLVEPVMHATPIVGGSVLASVAGVNWIVRRRMQQMHGPDASSNGHGGGEQ
ncbi:4Fe-4S dicluster domain-containing protein [bacterium]|nr:4Fe-4S dicluster domain-containing protein [bacterium]